MQLEKWLAERLESGVVIIRALQQRQPLGSGSYVGLDVRAYMLCEYPDGAPVVMMAHINEKVTEGGDRQRGRVNGFSYPVNDDSMQAVARRIAEGWIPQWKDQSDHRYVVNRTPYPVCNPSATRQLSRIQGGLEVLADQRDNQHYSVMYRKVARALDRVVTDAQKELQIHVAFPRS